MSHAFLQDARFWRFLVELDEDLAVEVRRAGCRHCGAVLHGARYPRKPRGVRRQLLGEAYERRLSFCCAREGCRRRATPPSVRFLGRRVYLSAVVVLVTALGQGLTGKRRARLRNEFGLSDRTFKRWRRWWHEVFPATPLWRGERARFVPPPHRSQLPGSLWERFEAANPAQRLAALLRFLAPISTRSEHAG